MDMSVRRYKFTGIKVSQVKDPTAYQREYYRRVRRFRNMEQARKKRRRAK